MGFFTYFQKTPNFSEKISDLTIKTDHAAAVIEPEVIEPNYEIDPRLGEGVTRILLYNQKLLQIRVQCIMIVDTMLNSFAVVSGSLSLF